MCRFPGLLRELEDSKAELGVDSYGLEVTTLEEVFMAVSAAAASADEAGRQQRNPPGSLAAPDTGQKAEQAEVALDVDGLPGADGSAERGDKESVESVSLLKVTSYPQSAGSEPRLATPT